MTGGGQVVHYSRLMLDRSEVPPVTSGRLILPGIQRGC
jgi:hypothetical protein